MTIPKQTADQREIARLRQSLMAISIWARCFDARHETVEKAMQDIVKETERALGVKNAST